MTATMFNPNPVRPYNPEVRSAPPPLPRFDAARFRPYPATAARHREMIAALDRHRDDVESYRDRTIARRAGLLATGGSPERLDELDADCAARAKDLERIAEVRAKLETDAADIAVRDAALLADQEARVAQHRARADALRVRLEAEYRPLARALAAILNEANALRRDYEKLIPKNVELIGAGLPTVALGEQIPIDRNAFVRDIDGASLFDGRLFAIWPHAMKPAHLRFMEGD